MKTFDIDWDRFILNYLPIRWRKPKTLAFIRGLMQPLFWIYGRFKSDRDKHLYLASKQQHITHVEGVLNDYFDAGFRRIRIVDSPEGFEPFEVFQEIENKAVFFYQDSEGEEPQRLWDFDESEYGGIDFVVQIPLTVAVDRRGELAAILKKYKTPGSSVIIQDI